MDLSNEYVIHIKKDGVEYLQFKKLLEYSDKINHAYSVGLDRNFRTIRDGGLEQEEYNKSVNDYKQLCQSIECNYINIVKPNQRHTNVVKIVNDKINIDAPDFGMEQYNATDGVITNKNNIVLATTNADCIIILLYDPEKNVIANVHSGWKGTLHRIIVNAIRMMCNEFGCKPENIIACMCPSIRKCHFEVEQDVKDLYMEEFKDIDSNDWIEETIKDKKWHIDTIFINRIMLQREGLKEENIVDSGICSVCNSNLLHSYRAEGKSFNLSTAIIELK